MTTKLIIVRHGNTFDAGQTPTRVGARTDLPLVAKGHLQAERVANWLAENNITPDVVLSGPLLRHKEMAVATTEKLNLPAATISPDLTEIDYGPDENKPEEDVIARVGENAIHLWNTKAIVPEGWQVNVPRFQAIWDDIATQYPNKTIVIFTSNGTARFALDVFKNKPTDALKLGTGCIGIIEKDSNANWHFINWNIKPA